MRLQIENRSYSHDKLLIREKTTLMLKIIFKYHDNEKVKLVD